MTADFTFSQKKTSLLGNFWHNASDKEEDLLMPIPESWKNCPKILWHLLHRRIPCAKSRDVVLTPFLRQHLPDPLHLPGIQDVIQHLIPAIISRQTIALWGDYDVDGMTSTAIWMRFLKMHHVPTYPIISDRLSEGYGVNLSGIAHLVEKNIKFLVILDSGTVALDVIAYARKQGIIVVIIDHHLPLDSLPQAHALVNPKCYIHQHQLSDDFRNLCTAGLSFMTLVGLARELRHQKGKMFSENDDDNPVKKIRSLLDLVALGTVCDVMPLKGLNFLFVKQGLITCSKTENVGLRALIQASNVHIDHVSVDDLGFILGPRLNAAGRIDDPMLGVHLLASDDAHQATLYAHKLCELNVQRQHMENTMMRQAISDVLNHHDHEKTPVIFVCGDENWHLGLVGIIAGRLKERFLKPSFVMARHQNIIRGSARSIDGIDIGIIIQKAVSHKIIEGGGGHQMAGGFSLRPDQVASFNAFLNDEMRYCLTQPNQINPLERIRHQKFDGILSLQAIKSKNFILFFQKMQPFGAEYSSPRFLIPNVMLSSVHFFGQGPHVRANVLQHNSILRVQLICFRVGPDGPLHHFFSSPPACFHLIASVQWSVFHRDVQLMFHDAICDHG